MTTKTKKEYLLVLQQRYHQCQTRLEKSVIISELVTNLKVHQKSAIRLLNTKAFRYRKPIPGRSEIYGFDLIKPLTRIWTVAGYPCSKRLKPQIPELIKRLKVFKEITFYGRQELKLTTMSTFTIDRLLAGERLTPSGHGLTGTKRSPLLKTLIPVRTNFDDVKSPGHIEKEIFQSYVEGINLNNQYYQTLKLEI